jgi:hypothetical protein
MAVKTRVNQLEKEHKARQSPKPFDMFSVYPGLALTEEVREAIRSYWHNETEAKYRALLAKYPEHKKDIENFMQCMNI